MVPQVVIAGVLVVVLFTVVGGKYRCQRLYNARVRRKPSERAAVFMRFGTSGKASQLVDRFRDQLSELPVSVRLRSRPARPDRFAVEVGWSRSERTATSARNESVPFSDGLRWKPPVSCEILRKRITFRFKCFNI
jgi:hypothetical protein